MNDETKLVSVDYDKWMNYYQPLEDINKELTYRITKLEKDLDDKDLTLFISVIKENEYMRIDYSYQLLNMLEYNRHRGIKVPYYKLEIKNINNIPQNTVNELLIKLKEKLMELGFPETLPYVKSTYNELENRSRILLDLEENLKNKYNKIPKFIKWLFKINI